MIRQEPEKQEPYPPLAQYRMLVASPEQVPQYATLAAEAIGIEFPLEYLSRGDVLLFAGPNGALGGGAVIVLQPPFRSLQSIPEGVDVPLDSLDDLKGVGEINGVWLGPPCRGSYLSYVFWRSLLQHALQTGCERFLFTYAHEARRIPAAYQLTRPRVLFSGRTRLLPGMKRQVQETVGVFEADILPDLVAVLDRHCGSMPESSVTGFITRGKGCISRRGWGSLTADGGFRPSAPR